MKCLLSLFLIIAATQVFAKRLPPPVVAPVNHVGLRYTPVFERDEQKYSVSIICSQIGRAAAIWKTTLYEIPYQMDLEKDVQDVHLAALSVENSMLKAVNEKGQTYRIALVSGQQEKAYIISGFDDVLRQAENTGLFKAAMKLFEQDTTFAGMPELYSLMTNQEPHAPRFVVVSAIATWFKQRITGFLLEEKFPANELFLRNWFTEFSIEEFKLEKIKEIIKGKPEHRFIIVFDNSNASLAMATKLYARYPFQIATIYLREVVSKPLPQGSTGFYTSFDIALNEVRLKRMNTKEATIVGYSVLEETVKEKIFPHYAVCPKTYDPCKEVEADLSTICRQVKEKVQQLCR